MQHVTHAFLTLGLINALGARSQTFTQLDDLPGDVRDGAISFVLNDHVYVGGGTGSKDLYMLDDATGDWVPKHDIPGVVNERWFAGAFVIGNTAYVGLGNDGTTFKRDLWAYDGDLDQWTQMHDYPSSARNAVFCFAVGGKGYVCGGADNSYIYSDVAEYDPETNDWEVLDPLPVGPTAFGSAFVIDDKAYIVGGDHGTDESADMYRFDPGTLQWTPRAPFIGPVRQTAVAFTLNGKGWFGLGQTGYTTPFNDLYTYDPEANAWNPAGTFPGGVRCWATACSTTSKAYLGTGWNFTTTFYKDWWTMEASVGIPEVDASELMLFPVPATDRLNIRLPDVPRADLRVLDQAGRLVRTGLLTQGLAEIELDGLAAGTYVLMAAAPEAAPLRMPFVKR
ncbi:MAG TPA: kelch repeat-containing protein [Flavobacteriales bacterium]|jgi:N-acetylneuraminic acid mutarotase|nr:kelch repeat-containing protein [Flavobacteriales bacterium]